MHLHFCCFCMQCSYLCMHFTAVIISWILLFTLCGLKENHCILLDCTEVLSSCF